MHTPQLTRRRVASQELGAFLRDPATRVDVTTYFTHFSGRNFNSADLTSRHTKVVQNDEFDCFDILAVECLSVRVPIEVTFRLLDPNAPLRQSIGALLRTVPAGVKLGTPAAANLVLTTGPATRAWHLLRNAGHVGWVTAGKLLARKRLTLISVWDGVLDCALGQPRKCSVWQALHGVLAAATGAIGQAIQRTNWGNVPGSVARSPGSRRRAVDVPPRGPPKRQLPS